MKKLLARLRSEFGGPIRERVGIVFALTTLAEAIWFAIRPPSIAFGWAVMGLNGAVWAGLILVLALRNAEVSPAEAFARISHVLRERAAVIVFLVLAAGALWALMEIPPRQVGRIKVDDSKRFELENEARKTIAQLVGGAFAIFALFLTWRRVRVTEQGHITDRYTQAIEQLGKVEGDKPNIEVRLGGIYALERIALDSPRDHWTIMEVLTTYVRRNAPAPAGPVDPAKVKPPGTDIQAILTVLGRRHRDARREKEVQHLDLSATDLSGADLSGGHLEGANLRGGHLEGANLVEARLERANLWEAHLEDTYLLGSHLEGARLWEAHLEGAELRQAHLEGAFLHQAHLEGAFLLEAHLEGAFLLEAHLEGAKSLTVDQVKSARAWEYAHYDPEFREKLGLPAPESETPNDEASESQA